MVTEYYLKIVQASNGFNYTVKFFIGEQCYCAEGNASTKIECLQKANEFESQMLLETHDKVLYSA